MLPPSDTPSPAQSSPELAQARQQALAQLCAQYQIATLYSFGSRSKEALRWTSGQQHALAAGPSDLDIGVRPIPGVRLSVRAKVELVVVLEDLFECARVDLVVVPEANPFVAADVIRGETLFARDTYEAAEYELYVLRRAGDLIPLERERQELILRGPRVDR